MRYCAPDQGRGPLAGVSLPKLTYETAGGRSYGLVSDLSFKHADTNRRDPIATSAPEAPRAALPGEPVIGDRELDILHTGLSAVFQITGKTSAADKAQGRALIRGLVAIAHPADQDRTAPIDITGLAIWASVSEEVDVRIREQMKAGVFPVRLKPEDWTSGSVNWLLDVIAPDRKTTGRVLANFGRVVKGGELRLHPVVAGLVDESTKNKLSKGHPQ